ncbi:MAG TPA: hypothetical protein VNA17_11225 [Pyrinomonadaceae bacterium]|nr:hypothetical protein [Pyrinomonadaceae bacterium]
MKTAVRALMWAHYVYLLLLPTLAVVSAQMMFPADDLYQVLLIVGFPPVLMYTLFLANGYALPDSLPIALIVTLAIPLQLALSVFLFGGGSIWLFFAESAAVEINSFMIGTLSSAFIIRRTELGSGGFLLLLALALVLFGGGFVSYILFVYWGYGGLSPWLILFATSFAVGVWEYAQVYKKVVAFSRKTKSPETIVMKFDASFLTRLFGLKDDVPMISPFRSAETEMSKPVLIFGFTAMFMPLVVGMIVAVALGMP